MSYDSASLTTPDIKWLGVRPSDLDRYNIPEQCRLDMTDHDIKTGKELLQVHKKHTQRDAYLIFLSFADNTTGPRYIPSVTKGNYP